MPPRSSARKLGILWTLYFVQGLPFGFQATALPVYLRDAGVSLAGVGLATALSLPWSLKILFAPLVDRYGGHRLGRRRAWILPLQLGLLGCCAVAALVPPERGLVPILVLVFGMNLFAATMDVAVDTGLPAPAHRRQRPRARGHRAADGFVLAVSSTA